MSNLPDFCAHGYRVERELGQNHAGGRVTYLATDIHTEISVVIKQFQFAQSGSNWSDYKAYEKEAEILKQLHHPNIPRYLNSFETPAGFCLVQEYKKALSLVKQRYFSPAEVKQIALAILQILVYLQQRNPAVIHRDIKPENILVNCFGQEIKVYLVDFGFAQIGGRELTASSVIKGTLGFMPPEQLFNRQLTEASDLYSLGMTLIALLTQTKSSDIGQLIDENYRLKVKQHLPGLNHKFVRWLEKMVSQKLENRFPNADIALKALKSIPIIQLKNQSLTTGRAGVIVGVIVLLGLVGIQIPRFFIKSSPSQVLVTPTPELKSEPSPSQLKSSSNSQPVSFYVSSLDSSYPYPDMGMKGTFEGEYRVLSDYVEVIVKKATVYNYLPNKKFTYLRSLKFFLSYYGTPQKWEKFPDSRFEVLQKNRLNYGESYTFTNIRFVIPKLSSTELSKIQMSFGIEHGFEGNGWHYVIYRPNW
ncbi:serine/threonine protein kinase [Nostoc sp. FACHB-152]|uniref:serine/threonine protein kinase n=1 Tax=unclassified Nostoc TaxID=2593658 RepID=UPI001681EA88|nr:MULTISPECIES: serine/threonine-protein kinase [unclassified Nostoc]MBD2445584.1 serine/threonine protein kinase [Nostoc sp. FACHB-152]MBD2466696.1 serine/threonine protein kinase [Nostoc sp. FACHB-145]